MAKVCKECHHLIDDDPHVCPTPEYIEQRDRLIAAAAEAQERFPQEELERYAQEKRNAKSLQGDSDRPAQ